jgi:CRP-like cAMP-binding protein
VKEALYILSDFMHALQKERGCASLFLCSQGKLFADELQAQSVHCDSARASFSQGFEGWKAQATLKPAQLNKLQALLTTCDALPALRADILTQKAALPQVISHYTHQLISPLLQVMVEIALYMPGHKPIFVSAYNAFLQWKERIGLERTIGVRGFVGYDFHNKEFLERILFLLSEQGNYRDTYMALASDRQKQLVQEVLNGEASTKLRALHEMLEKSPEAPELYELTPQAWFALITAKMDALQAIEKKLLDTLSQDDLPSEHANVAPVQTPQTPAKEAQTAAQISRNAFGEYDRLINALQLFSGISADNFGALLRHAQIREFHKGKLLFLEGEQANRLYIILKGWVKIFKGTASGDETILQMLSSGDSIMESAVFLNTSLPVSAQIAEDATLLSIPAPVIREQVKNNNELALNLLASMSYRSQGLIRQIENARLKSVDERIGWFLLRLLLEQGHISRQVTLPYDKSLIASYLDMKRETFSRSLKRLKAKGFKVENDMIVIPNLESLCGFCDSDTAHICALHGTAKCPKLACKPSMQAECA